YGLGEHSAAAVQAFGPSAVHFATVEALVAALEHDLQDDGPAPLVLIKGSRGMRMERVVAALAAAGRAVQGDH
ncbi:MAG TPA: UDP-N-acetylmuramoylalanyl-D-glutamyl-2, 6-diaminopimelate--D-alanyl-D-alanine ligase, partial [Candidatus Competibacteraceae bacterium]|nr:UDP-N-acetylmuramoylalanyl-D-glutamyl-2, 6-diaminopimelate--D-alanyl-D-alanine ligase [Candidatus Competibacteraceae bacterium]